MSTVAANLRSKFQDGETTSHQNPETNVNGQNWRDEDWNSARGGVNLAEGAQAAFPQEDRKTSELYEASTYGNVNNNNAGLASGSQDKICKIEVVKSCRKLETDLNMEAKGFYPAGGVNNTNIISCGQLDNAKSSFGNGKYVHGVMNVKRSSGDISNNNKVLASPAKDAPCIVDNLVMEAEKIKPKSPQAVGNKQEQPSQPVTAYQSAVTSEANQVPLEMSFTDPRQSQVFQMLTGIQHLRKDRAYTDITVRVKGVDFRCHSFVLSINSPYLRAMVQDSTVQDTEKDLAELKIKEECTGHSNADTEASATSTKDSDAQNDEKQNKGSYPRKLPASQDDVVSLASLNEGGKLICLKGMEPDVFSKMLDFMYCCFEDVITEENCLELLLAANTVQMAHLRRTCATFVTDTLSAGNVFRVMQLCDSGYANLFETRVMKRAHQVIRENFPQLSSAEEFLRLGRHVMIPLLADSMLHTRSEMDVLQALLRWVKAKPEERCSDMTLMLQHVRFPLMSSRELEKLREVPILKQNSLAMALIEESRAYGNLDYNERMAWPRHNSISRCLFSTRDLILWTADRDKGLHFYSIIDGQHHKVTSFGQLTAPPPSSSSAVPNGGAAAAGGGNFSFDSTSSVCCYGDKVFFTGGEFNTDMVWSVDTGSGEVRVHSKMPRGRKFHSMVASKGCVYCLGGQDKRGYTVLEDVDAYIINKDMWLKVGHLAVPAYNMSAAVCGGAVYLVGGLDHAGQPLRLIQCFIALRSGLYSAFKVEVSNMPPSLLSARAVACGLDKTIYIVCGHGEVYQFEAEHQSLSLVTTLKNLSDNPRVRFGLAYVGGCLVVIGGHQLGHVMHEPIRSVCLDIASKTEVRDYSPLLPGDIVNTCLAAKLSSNILRLFNE